eukprot:2856952-Pyramimonas_sp.AAC.1
MAVARWLRRSGVSPRARARTAYSGMDLSGRRCLARAAVQQSDPSQKFRKSHDRPMRLAQAALRRGASVEVQRAGRRAAAVRGRRPRPSAGSASPTGRGFGLGPA